MTQAAVSRTGNGGLRHSGLALPAFWRRPYGRRRVMLG